MTKRTKREKSGPKPDTLKIEGTWESAVGKALKKKRPEKGWPKEKKKGSD
jgi:hypothetical protein